MQLYTFSVIPIVTVLWHVSFSARYAGYLTTCYILSRKINHPEHAGLNLAHPKNNISLNYENDPGDFQISLSFSSYGTFCSPIHHYRGAISMLGLKWKPFYFPPPIAHLRLRDSVPAAYIRTV